MINLYLSLFLDFLLIITCLFVHHENKQVKLKIFQVLSERKS